jgi:hypothetical protein
MCDLDKLVKDTTDILKAIPNEHRGILFERVFEQFHPYKDIQLLERSFSLEWAKRNSEAGGELLFNLLYAETINDSCEHSPQHESLPDTVQEWDTAYLVAATLIQWLPTPAGCSFLRKCFEAGGRTFHATPTPKI